MDDKTGGRKEVPKLTLAGRVLVLIHVMMAVGGTLFYVFDFIPKLPKGRYPLFMFAVPVVLFCFVSFRFATWVVGRFGVRIYTDE